MEFKEVFLTYILPALLTLLGTIFAVLGKVAIQYVKSRFKQLNHFKGDSIVHDAIIQSIDELEDEMQKALSDGKLDKNDLVSFKRRVTSLAESKLKHLYGFYKSDLVGWINERVDIALPKFISPRIKAFVSKNL